MAAVASLFNEVTLMVLADRPGRGGVRLPRGCRVVPLPMPTGRDLRRKLSVAARLPWYLRAIAREVRAADVVHVPPPGDIPLLGILVALALGKPLIVRYCGSWEPTSETTLANRVTRQLMRLAARRGHVMLATGLGDGSPADGIDWIFTTAFDEHDVARIRPDLARAPHRPLQVVCIARLLPVKGVRYLLGALGRLRRSGMPQDELPRLTIAGEGPERPVLEQLAAEEDCAPAVRFVGQLDRDQLMELLCQSDVCVLPSLSESFCKARLEAMLCGTPVITTPVGGGDVIVGASGERGWLVPPGDSAALADVLRESARAGRDWPALRARCRRYAERFTLENWTRELRGACLRRWGGSR